ncbi:MAG: hypothetical protein A3H98_07285 [Bacteroidetes bacterium RIFCSPLOWO2_02_FULL_36_8]|nr:MAG: hypothetical protein A3H98_07285 [Bacteroidetes bacterium RIFCSPLOWO2_02_FULL_36_8]OFY69673.1 MAG: hypothetical protein A3G23_14180 [Bacteroidetes bacterium RIFCSPLOWO2_12_FULL_37_12]
MKSQEAFEKKSKRIAWIVSISFHTLILLLFFLIVIWKPPFPPLPEFGMEINFGTSDEGSGQIQPETKVAETVNTQDALPEPPAETNNDPVKETVTPNTESKEPTLEEEAVKEKTTESATTPEPEPVSAVPKAPSFPKPSAKSVKSEKKSTDSGAEGEKGKSKEVPGANQGDKTGKVGDQGDPKGSIDAKSLYGKAGKGGNFLEMTGWQWADEPKFDDRSPYSGKIVFQIKIDGSGEIVSVKAVEASVPNSVIETYKKEIEKGSFVPTRENKDPAPSSVGKYTVIIKAR